MNPVSGRRAKPHPELVTTDFWLTQRDRWPGNFQGRHRGEKWPLTLDPVVEPGLRRAEPVQKCTITPNRSTEDRSGQPFNYLFTQFNAGKINLKWTPALVCPVQVDRALSATTVPGVVRCSQ
ncbi:hypothetical protein L0U85_05320 [Glycomyces sp. L485]|uniref:hypothetical protein n=1 Tax=Glycomyces sp. L485 TaxID=2909235 RepID=UPI001F4A470D|nr:hypothetical protein [Glycomyces sp. L485]MCH7230278.1 hypothetical protein [Glycomyces sp. L485]